LGFVIAVSPLKNRQATQATDPPALLFIDNQGLIGFSHKQNLAVLADESSYALMKHHVLLAIQGKFKHPKFYYISVAKSKQACGKSGETLKF